MLRYCIILNILSFLFIGYDKKQAIKKKSRIPEIVLFTLSMIGGSYGTLIGMILFHHKTKKINFQILIPIFIILNTLIYIKILLN